MLWILPTFVQFYMNLVNQYLLAEHFCVDFINDTNVDKTSEHPHYHRFTRRYQRKSSIFKNYWIGEACIVLLFPLLHVALPLVLLTKCISSTILDETE